MAPVGGNEAMANTVDRRRDFLTSRQITRALSLASEYGYDQARNHMKQSGIPDELADHILLIRYDRRCANVNNPAQAAPHDPAL